MATKRNDLNRKQTVVYLEMTYFLQKYYNFDFDHKLQPVEYGHCLIRQCNWEYKDVLDFFNRKMPKEVSLCLDELVALYDYPQPDDRQDFKTIEEWLIWLDLTKGISPDFETMHVCTIDHQDDYIVKIIDLNTNEVLYDSVVTTLVTMKKKIDAILYSTKDEHLIRISFC